MPGDDLLQQLRASTAGLPPRSAQLPAQQPWQPRPQPQPQPGPGLQLHEQPGALEVQLQGVSAPGVRMLQTSATQQQQQQQLSEPVTTPRAGDAAAAGDASRNSIVQPAAAGEPRQQQQGTSTAELLQQLRLSATGGGTLLVPGQLLAREQRPASTDTQALLQQLRAAAAVPPAVPLPEQQHRREATLATAELLEQMRGSTPGAAPAVNQLQEPQHQQHRQQAPATADLLAPLQQAAGAGGGRQQDGLTQVAAAAVSTADLLERLRAAPAAWQPEAGAPRQQEEHLQAPGGHATLQLAAAGAVAPADGKGDVTGLLQQLQQLGPAASATRPPAAAAAAAEPLASGQLAGQLRDLSCQWQQQQQQQASAIAEEAADAAFQEHTAEARSTDELLMLLRQQQQVQQLRRPSLAAHSPKGGDPSAEGGPDLARRGNGAPAGSPAAPGSAGGSDALLLHLRRLAQQDCYTPLKQRQHEGLQRVAQQDEPIAQQRAQVSEEAEAPPAKYRRQDGDAACAAEASAAEQQRQRLEQPASTAVATPVGVAAAALGGTSSLAPTDVVAGGGSTVPPAASPASSAGSPPPRDASLPAQAATAEAPEGRVGSSCAQTSPEHQASSSQVIHTAHLPASHVPPAS